MGGTILLIFALVFFIIRSFMEAGPFRPDGWSFPHLGWLGLAFWVASLLFASPLFGTH